MAAKFVLKENSSGNFTFNLCAANGQVVLTSQPYKSKASAQNGIESVKTNCLDDDCFERKTAKSDQPFFTLKSTNGQIIGKSQMYSSVDAMEKGIASVRTNAPEAPINED